MKVLMVLARSTGGIGTHVGQLSADLRDLGVEVIVATHPQTAAHFDLGPVRLCWPGSAGRVHAVADLGVLRRLAAKSDVVHAHGHQGALVAALATLGMRDAPALVVSQHNAVLEGSGRQLLKRLSQRWVAAHADLVTGASRDLVSQALAFGAVRAELAEVPSPRVPGLLAQRPADRSAREQIRRSLLTSPFPHEDQSLGGLSAVDPSAPLVVTISRIAPQKNLGVLVQAASRLRHPCSWVVLGSGDPQLLARLRLQSSDLGAPVHFVGSRREVEQWLRAADVFVLPSVWEARALVVQEAMAAGTPVVATDVGGLPDLVHGSGLLVAPGDPDELAAAVGRILADPALREALATAGREAAGALRDGHDTASRWLTWYGETVRMT